MNKISTLLHVHCICPNMPSDIFQSARILFVTSMTVLIDFAPQTITMNFAVPFVHDDKKNHDDGNLKGYTWVLLRIQVGLFVFVLS